MLVKQSRKGNVPHLLTGVNRWFVAAFSSTPFAFAFSLGLGLLVLVRWVLLLRRRGANDGLYRRFSLCSSFCCFCLLLFVFLDADPLEFGFPLSFLLLDALVLGEVFKIFRVAISLVGLGFRSGMELFCGGRSQRKFSAQGSSYLRGGGKTLIAPSVQNVKVQFMYLPLSTS